MTDAPRVVAVTGASGYIGSRLLQELEQQETLEKIVAIDLRSPSSPLHNMISRKRDVAQPLDDLFKELSVDTVVHLAFNMRTGRNYREVADIRNVNLQGLNNVLKSCTTSKVRLLIYLSSHTVYGAHRDNPIPIIEEAAMRPIASFQYSMDKYLSEQVLGDYSRGNSQTSVTILRTCVVMGPSADNFVSRALFKPVLIGVWGHDPPLQFVHEYDLARLLRLLIMEPQPGVYNVAGESVVSYTKLARLSRRKLVFLPPVIAYPLTQIAWKLGVQKDSPAAGLDFVRYPMVISTAKLKKETGFQFHFTSEEALTAYISTNLP